MASKCEIFQKADDLTHSLRPFLLETSRTDVGPNRQRFYDLCIAVTFEWG